MKLDHAEEMIDLAEADEIAHRNYLSEFDDKVWPMFERYGYTKDAALLAWTLNKINSNLRDIREIVGDRGWPT